MEENMYNAHNVNKALNHIQFNHAIKIVIELK